MSNLFLSYFLFLFSIVIEDFLSFLLFLALLLTFVACFFAIPAGFSYTFTAIPALFSHTITAPTASITSAFTAAPTTTSAWLVTIVTISRSA